MFIVNSYQMAIFFCVVTMLCWGSWAITSKCTNQKWTFPLYYWDYSIGMIIAAVLYGVTMGMEGGEGRGLLDDLGQADSRSILYAFSGGVVFNLSNLLIVAAIAVAGISVAFPIAVGLALVLGVVLNYLKLPVGDPYWLFGGVGLVVVAMIINAYASGKRSASKGEKSFKGILLSVASGLIMAFFYRLVAEGLSLDFSNPEAGKLTTYSAVIIFSIGLFLSNFLWNTFFMYKPVTGEPSSYKGYLINGTIKQHLIGMSGGLIFNTGFLFNLLAAEKAGIAISYGLGQGATMVGVIWGVFVFREFAGAPKQVNWFLAAMFVFFITGLSMIVLAKTMV